MLFFLLLSSIRSEETNETSEVEALLEDVHALRKEVKYLTNLLQQIQQAQLLQVYSRANRFGGMTGSKFPTMRYQNAVSKPQSYFYSPGSSWGSSYTEEDETETEEESSSVYDDDPLVDFLLSRLENHRYAANSPRRQRRPNFTIPQWIKDWLLNQK